MTSVINRRNFLKAAGLGLSSAVVHSAVSAPAVGKDGYDGLFPQHPPMGKGLGTMPGRVVWAYDPECVHWSEGYWWEPKNFDADRIQKMVDRGIAAVAGKATPAEAWEALFKYHNGTRGKGAVGYKRGEKIAIKTNMNGAGWSGPNSAHTANAFTNPVALRALLVSMVRDGGIASEDITVYDASRNFTSILLDYLKTDLVKDVRYQWSEEGSPNDCQPDRNAPLIWSKSFSGERSYLPTVVTQAEYLINFADLKGHSSNGITLTAKNHFGSIMNSDRIASPVAANLHQFVSADAMNRYTVLVDLMGHYLLGAKTMLYLLDGIIVSTSEGGTTTLRSENSHWQSAPFNGGYTSSLFFSQDPVAIDSVGADFLGNEPTLQRFNSVIRNNPKVENYLHEAGGVARAPSGTTYRNGNGERIMNLGVHEHWNNCTERKYSRNLGKDEGIELVRV